MRKRYKTVSTTTSLELIEKNNKHLVYADFDLVHQVLSRVSVLKDEIVVIKIPSELIKNDELLKIFLKNVALLQSCQARVILVHDYDDIVEHVTKLFGIDLSILQEMQISDHKSSNIIEMVLSGYINKKIVSILCNFGCNALGLSGKDCGIIRAKQRVKKVTNKNLINFGFVADPTMINPEAILGLLDSNITLVLSPVASCYNGSTCIIDTNITSAIIASALAAKYLILPCANPNIEGDGIVFTDFDKNHLNHMKIDPKSSDAFKSILDTSLSAIENYVNYVCIINSDKPESMLHTIFCIEHDDSLENENMVD